MKLTKQQISGFYKVLKAEGLEDLSQFCKHEFCDEVPLYSRYTQVASLDDLELEEANPVLLDLGLNFLENIVKKSSPEHPFFAALTVWEEEGDEPIVPRIFICNKEPKGQLKQLVLHRPSTAFSKKIRKLLMEITPAGKYQVFEDDETLPDKARVFIGQRRPPYPAFVILRSFLAKRSQPSKT
jgi:hypothetical protein